MHTNVITKFHLAKPTDIYFDWQVVYEWPRLRIKNRLKIFQAQSY